MEIKLKITYINTYGNIMAAIVTVQGYYDLSNQILNSGIIESSVLKIERILEASSENTTTF
jgi:hypothetical protein